MKKKEGIMVKMEQTIKLIDTKDLIQETLLYKHNGYRLVQICATRLEEGFELTYSFALDKEFEGIRIQIQPEEEVPSISSIYSYSFLYENEMKDLFGINITKISLDYQGNFYRTGVKTPFNTPKGE